MNGAQHASRHRGGHRGAAPFQEPHARHEVFLVAPEDVAGGAGKDGADHERILREGGVDEDVEIVAQVLDARKDRGHVVGSEHDVRDQHVELRVAAHCGFEFCRTCGAAGNFHIKCAGETLGDAVALRLVLGGNENAQRFADCGPLPE